jgi:hypothetical protein
VKPLETVYWLRFGLGLVSALVCVGYMFAAYGLPFPSGLPEDPAPFNIFLNSMSLTIVVYLVSYYIIKAKFKFRVEKTQKLFTTGIGVYFLTWLVFFALFYTTLAGP